MNEITFLIEDTAEGGYVARALSQSIFTEADTWQGLQANIREAVACHFEEGQAPKFIRLNKIDRS